MRSVLCELYAAQECIMRLNSSWKDLTGFITCFELSTKFGWSCTTLPGDTLHSNHSKQDMLAGVPVYVNFEELC